MNRKHLFLILILLLFVLGSCRKSINNPDLTYIDNHAFGLELFEEEEILGLGKICFLMVARLNELSVSPLIPNSILVDWLTG